MRTHFIVYALAMSGIAGSCNAQSTPTPFNKYILTSVDHLAKTRAGGGYDLSAAFTQPLQYGPECCVKSTHDVPPHTTMCVAAVSEVIVEALNQYYTDTHDAQPFTSLPLSSWNRGNITSIKANIFIYQGTGSAGTASALQRLGLGEQRSFSKLSPGDFINFNRKNGTGHSVVFLGYLDPQSSVTNRYSDDVVGFKYFSAQGRGRPDAGFGFRYAYFDGSCPNSASVPRDCGIIRSSNQHLLNTGTMYEPRSWKVGQAVQAITRSIEGSVKQSFPGRTRGFIDNQIKTELERELSVDLSAFTGETTD